MKGLLAEIKNNSKSLQSTTTIHRKPDGTVIEETRGWSETGEKRPASALIAENELVSVTLREREAHGLLGEDRGWPTAPLVAHCELAVRRDQGNYTASHEFCDTPEVLREKIHELAALIERSSCTTVYAGAGLSKSTGIRDYASKAPHSVSSAGAPPLRLASALHALPSAAHRVLAAMFLEERLTVENFVQQNHDGLPQKAGIPQHMVNEIHGAWFDPSNPVVKFNGSLRADLFQRLEDTVAATDLCLVLGTSLSGMSADRCASTPARKMTRGEALGTVIINLQRTPLDDQCALRIWAPIDQAMSMLAETLRLRVAPLDYQLKRDECDVFQVPYDAQGTLNLAGSSQTLDLRNDSRLVINHPESVHAGCHARVVCKDQWGNYQIEVLANSFPRVRRYMLGKWWRNALMNGTEQFMPLKNL